MMTAMRDAIGENPLMAYLAMMAVRLVELHRVLKPTGSLYLHCDPTASHYLKLVLDAVFGAENFRNEIVWRRSGSHNDVSRKFGPVHDNILFYARSEAHRLNDLRLSHSKNYVDGEFRFSDSRGPYRLNEVMGPGIRMGDSGKPWRGYDPTLKARHWAIPDSLKRLLTDPSGMSTQNVLDELYDLDELYVSSNGRPKYKQRPTHGVGIQDMWAYQPGTEGVLVGTKLAIDEDVKWLSNEREKLGYPTQKPVGLLCRIIAASSNPGDLVLDPFCGCGTAVDAAQKLGRRWVGIDITHLAIGMIEDRMRVGYPDIVFETIGVPRDRASAERLAADDPHQFQQWVCWQVGGFPRAKKGGDKGVDGWFNYHAAGGKTETGVISVKAGDHVNPAMVRDLGRVMEREKHRFGLFIMKDLPTRGMEAEAASQPLVETEFGRFPALQFVTLAELFQGIGPKLPPLVSPVKKASRVETRASHQQGAQGDMLG